VRAQQTPDLVDACGADPGDVCRWVLDQTGSVGLAQAAGFLAGPTLRILLVLALAGIATLLTRRAVPRVVSRVMRERERLEVEVGQRLGGGEVDEGQALRRERNRARAQTLGSVLSSMAAILIWIIAGLLVLGELGVQLGPLLAGAGIVGLAVGFGAQSLVRDFFTGTFILLEDQYGVGDVVDLGEADGVVERVGFRVTRLRDVNGVVWYVPNGEIKRVGNRSQLWSRAVLDISVSYDADLDRVITILGDTARQLWEERDERFQILAEPEVWGVERFEADGIAIRLVVRTVPNQQWTTARELRARIKRAFDANGIEIPFPQRTVWVRTESAGTDEQPAEPPEPTETVDGPTSPVT
jgi:moderate conductance mechanosensitive channel